MGLREASAAGEIFALDDLNEQLQAFGDMLDGLPDTLAGARQALPMLEQKLSQLGAQRGVIGAFEARASSALSTLQASSENYAAAESRIRDADIAAETAELVRLQINQQAATAVLAQANQAPALAIQMLRNVRASQL